MYKGPDPFYTTRIKMFNTYVPDDNIVIIEYGSVINYTTHALLSKLRNFFFLIGKKIITRYKK